MKCLEYNMGMERAYGQALKLFLWAVAAALCTTGRSELPRTNAAGAHVKRLNAAT